MKRSSDRFRMCRASQAHPGPTAQLQTLLHTAPAPKSSLRTTPALTAGNPSPNPSPKIKPSSLTESLEIVGIPPRIQGLRIFGTKMLGKEGMGAASWDFFRAPAPRPAAWHLAVDFGWRCCTLLPAAAKISQLLRALAWGELPGPRAFSATPVPNHQSSGQSYLACLIGTG